MHFLQNLKVFEVVFRFLDTFGTFDNIFEDEKKYIEYKNQNCVVFCKKNEDFLSKVGHFGIVSHFLEYF